MNRHVVPFRYVFALWLSGVFFCCGLCLRAGLPKGRQILRNGDFLESETHPKHWVTYGQESFGDFSILLSERDSPSRLLSVEVSKTSPKPWALQLRQALTSPLGKGETLFLSFEYRMTSGYAFFCYWQQSSEPYDKFLSIRLAESADDWRRCTMAVPVHEDLAARQSSLTFHLAGEAGTVQFRNFNAVVCPPAVPPETLPVTHYPVLGGDYHDKNWRNKALHRIRQIRQAELKVHVVRGGQAVPEVAVTVRQKRRDFLFGAETCAPVFGEPFGERPEFAELTEKLAGVKDKLGRYRSWLLTPNLFNMVSFDQALSWPASVAWKGLIEPDMLNPFLEKDMLVRGHSLYCPAFRFAPPACRGMGKAELRQALLTSISERVGNYRDKVSQWDVVHAPLTYEEIYDLIGEQSLVDAFKTARANDPTVKLAFSDDKALLALSLDHMEEMLSLVKWMRSNGAEIQILVLNAGMMRPYVAPQIIEARLNRIFQDTGLPIMITALGVDASKENLQAERLSDLLTLFFSHPGVVGVGLAETWEALATVPGSALFRRNFVIKPAGKQVETLLTKQWWTEIAVRTDVHGLATVSGFLGDYEVIVEAGDHQVSRQVTLDKGGSEFAIDLQPIPGQPD